MFIILRSSQSWGKKKRLGDCLYWSEVTGCWRKRQRISCCQISAFFNSFLPLVCPHPLLYVLLPDTFVIFSSHCLTLAPQDPLSGPLHAPSLPGQESRRAVWGSQQGQNNNHNNKQQQTPQPPNYLNSYRVDNVSLCLQPSNRPIIIQKSTIMSQLLL